MEVHWCAYRILKIVHSCRPRKHSVFAYNLCYMHIKLLRLGKYVTENYGTRKGVILLFCGKYNYI